MIWGGAWLLRGLSLGYDEVGKEAILEVGTGGMMDRGGRGRTGRRKREDEEEEEGG